MPKLPLVGDDYNYQLEYAEFLTDEELNAKYTGQKNFCDCTQDLWGGDYWTETPTRGCGEVLNKLCEGNELCQGYEPCVTYGLSFYCTCRPGQIPSQSCDVNFDRSRPLNPAPWGIAYKPHMIPFLNSPIFNPGVADWLRGWLVVFNEPLIPYDWPVQSEYELYNSGWMGCVFTTFQDGRDFCARYYPPQEIYHRDIVRSELNTRHNRDDCYKNLEKKLYYADKYVCDLIPEGEGTPYYVFYDHYFRVDLDPSNPDNIMIPGDPLPIGRRFKIHLFVTNTWIELDHYLDEQDRWVRNISWRFSQERLYPKPLHHATTYQLHFRHCTHVFSFSGCSKSKENAPVYNQYKQVVIRVQGHKHPSVRGCPTMVPTGHLWISEPGTLDMKTFPDGKAHFSVPAWNRQPTPASEKDRVGTGKSGNILRITFRILKDFYLGKRNNMDGIIVVTHDFEQRGHPRVHMDFTKGLNYVTRDLCYFFFKYNMETLRPLSEHITQSCDDNSLELKINRPFYFEEPVRIDWVCLDPLDLKDPCTVTRSTESSHKKFEEYKDFVYDLPMDCTSYVWQMTVNYLSRPDTHLENQYRIYVERRVGTVVPVQIRTLSASDKTYTVNPEEPNYFYIKTTPHRPDVWVWQLWKVVSRAKNGEAKRERITSTWRQPRTSTYICIIPPFTLENKSQEYLLIGDSILGKSSYSFHTNPRPELGSCDVNPKSGVAGAMFHVRCQNFTDEQGPLSYTIVGFNGLDETPWLEYFSFSSGTAVETDVHLFKGDAAVLIFDDEDRHIRVPLEIEVTDPVSPPDIHEFLTERLPLMIVEEELVAVTEMTKLTYLFEKLKMPIEEFQKIQLLKALSEAIDFDSPTDGLVRGMMTLKNLFANQLEQNRTMSDRVIQYGGEILHNFADIFRDSSFRETLKYYDQKRMVELFTFMAATIFELSDPIVVEDSIREDEHEAHLRRTALGTYHAMVALDHMGEMRRKKQYFQLMPTFKSTHKGLTLFVQVNNASTFNTEFSPDIIEGHTMTLPQETVDLLGDIPIFSKMVSTIDKAFWWEPNDSGILSVTAESLDNDDFDLFSNWTKLVGPFNIYLKMRNFSKKAGSLSGLTRVLPSCNSSWKLQRSLIVYHMKAPMGAGVVFLNFAQESLRLLKVLISVTSRPTYKDVSESGVLENNILLLNFLNLNKEESSDVYIGILPAGIEPVPVKYDFVYKIVQCTTYQNGHFEAAGCEFRSFLEEPDGDPRVWCECSHLSWFSSVVTVPQQRIIFAEDIYLFSSTYYYYHAALAMGGLVFLFCLLLIWARKKDREDKKARYVAVLPDNWCSDTHPYIVAVYTGQRWSAGTTSRVAIRIFGNKGHSRAHVFHHPKRRVLRSGLDDWFLLKTKRSLGSLTSIQMWHNHSGTSPEWYCVKIVIYDVKTGGIYTFLVNKWFTFDVRVKLDRARFREVPVTKPRDNSGDWPNYIAGWIFSGMRDKHIWASIFTRHPRSMYTRSERTIIALGLIITTMLMSMILLSGQNGPADVPEVSVEYSYVWTGIQSALIAIVLQLFVVFCFEVSKKRKMEDESEQRNDYLQTLGSVKSGSTDERSPSRQHKMSEEISKQKPPEKSEPKPSILSRWSKKSTKPSIIPTESKMSETETGVEKKPIGTNRASEVKVAHFGFGTADDHEITDEEKIENEEYDKKRDRWSSLKYSSEKWSRQLSRLRSIFDEVIAVSSSKLVADEVDEGRQAVKAISPKPITYDTVILNTGKKPIISKFSKFFFVLAWVLEISIIILFSIILVLNGLTFGAKKSLVWLIAFLSGIATDVILFQPLKMLLLAVSISFVFRKSNIDTFVMEVRYEEVKKNVADWRKCLKRMLLTRLKTYYCPATTIRILQKRTRLGSRRNQYLLYYEIIGFLLLAMIFLFVYGFEMGDSYYGLRHLAFYFQKECEQLKTKENLYHLFRHKLIPALHVVYWYNRVPLPLEGNEKAHNVQFYDPRLSSKARGYVQDYTNKVVGSPRLRQHRLKNHTTVIPRAFSIFFKEAYGQYFWFREDHESYLPGWMVHDVNTGNLSLLWQYKSASETESTAVRGRSGWLYGGGGYVAPLSWNGGDSWRAIHNLEFDNWVDKKTRLIVFEINLYNNNLKRFTELRFIIEALSNGFYYTRYQLRCTSFFFKDKPQAQLILALTSVMTVVLLSLAFFMIVQISRDGTAEFFSVFRGYLDVMVLFFGFLTISYFFSRALQYSLFLERLDRSPRDVHTPFVKPFSINEDGLMLFGIFTLFTVLHAMLSIYQAVQYRKFNFMFLKIVGMLIALLFLNVSLSYFLHFSTYIEDRDPVVNLFLHSILR
ncbi:hypothetical protein GE061_015059 [Apolygus lucorum]|uniref:PLAT domain-containing protein n=1 Tax=Apolygus lucorum TaxID=248454 RepID=A0A8S9XJY1_APOLU|nr:hypothetical protein GE061_015059 [Apolygus lucorum]